MLLNLFARLPWPLPALVGWALAWAAFVATRHSNAAAALLGACALGALWALTTHGLWRRALVAAGFPLSALALGAAPTLPAWSWLLAALPLLVAYPLRAWRDAPFFPTPANALAGLDGPVSLAPGARVLDIGCGLGHGLHALHRLWPAAQIEGIEWSRPLAWAAARRCRFARVARADMWRHCWAGVELLYLFQRPESMARAWAKANAEMSPGAWFVSLEFSVPGQAPLARLGAPGARPLWVYRIARPGGAAVAVLPNNGSIGRAQRR